MCKSQSETAICFCSVLNSEFTIDSDIDLLVDFNTSDPIEYAENYFALKLALQELLNQQIDLLEQKALKNKYRVESINNTKKDCMKHEIYTWLEDINIAIIQRYDFLPADIKYSDFEGDLKPGRQLKGT